MEQFLQGNVPLRHQPNEETLFMSWPILSTIKEVNDVVPNLFTISAICLHFKKNFLLFQGITVREGDHNLITRLEHKKMGKMELIREFSKEGFVMVRFVSILFIEKNNDKYFLINYLFILFYFIFSTSKSWIGISKPSDISKDNYDKLLVYIHTISIYKYWSLLFFYKKELIIIDVTSNIHFLCYFL